MTPHEIAALVNALWWFVWFTTECADCAGEASNGRPWGADVCWAQHRSHKGNDLFYALVS